ncbi:hypothetical protein ABPG77_006347 [Micractinium sp. CCAP 211/92]
MLRKLRPRKSASRWLGAGETELELEKFFTVKKLLGKGSFAAVYRVKRQEDGQLYALKVADIKALSPLDQADAVNEIRLLASLSHPNLTTFFEAFCDHGKLCVVQELVNGGDLSTLLKHRAGSGMHLSEEQMWATFLQVALGLQYLHHNHVLHRDLKPANLLVTSGGVVKIADLGIAQLLDRVFARTMIGTPHYMAPEMWRRQPYSFSADVWALGCILHELCTLRPLFLGSSDAETKQKVLAGVAPPLSARYSQDLQALVDAMLQPTPEARPTVDEILATPAAQHHLQLLPEELRQRCISPALGWEHERARLLGAMQVPRGSEDWELLNELMPAPRYPSGSSVAGALVRSKAWRSTGDLQALAAASSPPTQAPGSASAGAPAGLGLASPPPPPAAEAAAAMRKSASHGSLSLAGAAEARIERTAGGLARRRSAAVGELSRLLAAPATNVLGGPAAGAGPLQVPAVPLHHRGLVLPAVAEHGASWEPPAGAAGAAPDAAGRTPGAVPRSKSLSVEYAVGVLARGPPLPDLPPRKAAAPPGQPAGTAGGLQVVRTAPMLPREALSAPSGDAPVRLQPAGGAAAGSGRDNSVEQPGQRAGEVDKGRKKTLWRAIRGKA